MKVTQSHGFSLIEIMVVLVIMGLMSAIVIPQISNVLSDGYITRVKTDLSNIESALKMYKLKNFRFPNSDQGLEALVEKTEIDPVPRHWHHPFLDKLPTDPWGNPYLYLSPSDDGKPYDLYSLGADGVRGGDGEDADISVWDEQ